MPPKTFKSLTPAQRKALIRAIGQGIKPDDEKIKPATIQALETHGLIHLTQSRKKRALWKATDTGRGLYAATGLIPTFLHRQSQYGYTHDFGRAVPGEPEAFYADAA